MVALMVVALAPRSVQRPSACRREGYEVAVGPPQVITKLVDGKKCEPYEEAHVEVPQEHMGQVCWLSAWGCLLAAACERCVDLRGCLWTSAAALLHSNKMCWTSGAQPLDHSMNVCCL